MTGIADGAAGLVIVSSGTTVTGVFTGAVDITGWFGSAAPTVGQKPMADSIPVVIASDQTQFPAALVGGRLDINNGAWLGSTAPTVGQKLMASSIPVVISSDQSAVTITTSQLPAVLVGGRLDINNGAWLGSTAPTVGQKTLANSIPVGLASDYQLQGAVGPSALASNTTNALPLLQFLSTPPTLTNAQVAVLQGDANGYLKNREQYAPVAEDNTNGVIAVSRLPLAVATYAWSIAFSTALGTGLVVKAGPGTLRSIAGRIDSTGATATYYIQVFNTTAVPADGTGTGSMLCGPVKIQHTTGTDTRFNIDFNDECIAATTGISICASTTEFTKTLIGTNIFSIQGAQYK